MKAYVIYTDDFLDLYHATYGMNPANQALSWYRWALCERFAKENNLKGFDSAWVKIEDQDCLITWDANKPIVDSRLPENTTLDRLFEMTIGLSEKLEMVFKYFKEAQAAKFQRGMEKFKEDFLGK